MSSQGFTPGKTIYLNNRDLLIAIKEAKEAKRMTDKLATMLQLLCSKYATKGNFVNYCVDDQTTALTKNGWKKYSDISEQDQLLSYDVDTGKLVWSEVFGIYKNNYDGPMHRLTTQGLDGLVTPTHKFVSVENGIVPVEDIICNEHIVLMGDPVDDPESIHTDHFVELVGWIVTEGSYSTESKRKHSISISQKQGIKADRIRYLLDSTGIKYKEYLNKKQIVIFNCSGEMITKIHQNIAPNRVLSADFIVSLTQHQRMLLINSMVSGNGWFRPSGDMEYFQKCKQHIDAFLMLCTIAGLTTGAKITNHNIPVSRENPNGGTTSGYSVIIYNTPKKFCKSERINFHGGRPTPGGIRGHKPNVPTEHYKGVVWCPQTEYGTFVCRRNDYIHVTGNSYNEDMQAYAMLMLVRTWDSFDPNKSNNPFAFYTQCIKNSFVQYLNQEKRQRNIRDLLLVDQGMNPSYGFQEEASDQHYVEDEQDFYHYKETALAIQQSLINEDQMFNEEGEELSIDDEEEKDDSSDSLLL